MNVINRAIFGQSISDTIGYNAQFEYRYCCIKQPEFIIYCALTPFNQLVRYQKSNKWPHYV
jgi:hypothetical protein